MAPPSNPPAPAAETTFGPLHFVNRELSWLEFNARVLEEAEDETNPLLERVKFLGIFSSNLDEFMMVRISGLRSQVHGISEPEDPIPDQLSPRDQFDRTHQRTRELVGKGFLAPQKLDQVQVQTQSAKAALEAAQSQVAEARASVIAAQAQVVEAQSAIETALAVQARIQTDLNDAQLKAPRPGRVQLLSARAGEVLSPGGRVMSLIDLSDVSMSFFLPEIAAGRLAIGSEARLVLDAAPHYVIPAKVTFVASNAQFTPKTVETQSERQKMVFKVKAQIDADLLKRYQSQVKTGMPGMAYVRVDAQQAWPEKLTIALPVEPAASAAP